MKTFVQVSRAQRYYSLCRANRLNTICLRPSSLSAGSISHCCFSTDRSSSNNEDVKYNMKDIEARTDPSLTLQGSAETEPKNEQLFKKLKEFQNKKFRSMNSYDPLEVFQSEQNVNEVHNAVRLGLTTTQFSMNEPVRKFENEEFHPANVVLLNSFLGDTGKIMPRWKTGLPGKQQRLLAKAIKRSRQIGLLPYVSKLSQQQLQQQLSTDERALIGYKRLIEKRPVGLPIHIKVNVE